LFALAERVGKPLTMATRRRSVDDGESESEASSRTVKLEEMQAASNLDAAMSRWGEADIAHRVI
jgi:hypothetical protein